MAARRLHPLPSVEMLRERLDYDPETGALTWRARTVLHHTHRGWNTRFAGAEITTTQNCGYVVLRIAEVGVLAHRVAWAHFFGEWPDGEIDHRDGDKTNNRISNLRIATRVQNMHNVPGRAPSGYKGVQRTKNGKRWQASIGGGEGKRKHLGTFDTKEEARDAYRRAALERHGEFANFSIVRRGTINATISITGKAA